MYKAGDSERIVEAELRDLIPFDNFRRLVLDRCGERVIYTSGQWFRDLLEASERGGVAIEVDHLAQAIWINEHSLPFAEAGYIAELMLSPAIRFEADLLEAVR